MDIQIDPHTLLRANERETNEAEIKNVINSGFIIDSKYGCFGKAKIYEFR